MTEESKRPQTPTDKKTWKNYESLNKTVKICVTTSEYQKLEQESKKLGFTKLSPYCRKRLFSRQVIVKTIDNTHDKLLFELNKIGTNINQIAFTLNQKGSDAFHAERIKLDYLTQELVKKIEQIRK